MFWIRSLFRSHRKRRFSLVSTACNQAGQTRTAQNEHGSLETLKRVHSAYLCRLSGKARFEVGFRCSGRNEGGSGGLNPPKCARKCANFRNLKANVQILDRKTPPPNGLPYFAYCLGGSVARQSRRHLESWSVRTIPCSQIRSPLP